MSIDDFAGGAGCGAVSLLARNRDDDFPEWRGRDLAHVLPNISSLSLARDGAMSETVLRVQFPQILDLGLRPVIVTLTMGGNDLLKAYGNDAAADAALTRFRDNGGAVLSELRNLLGDHAPILLGTIYDPSDGTGDTARLQIAAWPASLHYIEAFNAEIRRLATLHKATLVEIHGAFLGHGLMAGNPAGHEARPENRGLYYCGVVEPNAWGASALRALWWNALVAARVVPEPA